jgi:hypothetical protein
MQQRYYNERNDLIDVLFLVPIVKSTRPLDRESEIGKRDCVDDLGLLEVRMQVGK